MLKNRKTFIFMYKIKPTDFSGQANSRSRYNKKSGCEATGLFIFQTVRSLLMAG